MSPPRFAARSHPGRVRSDNEDSIGWDVERRLWLVADGMGGHAAGDVASRITTEQVLEWSPTQGLAGSLSKAHDAVRAAAAADERLTGMGSTVVAAQFVADDTFEIVWLGDSRAYLWRDGALRQLTRDHSYLEELRQRMAEASVAGNTLSNTEIQQHPHRHVVTRAIGMTAPNPGVVRERLLSGDRLLLVSDGLNDELSDAAIADLLLRGGTPEEAAEGLMNAALAHGGHDNVSVIVIDAGKRAAGPRMTAEVKSALFAALAGILLAVLSVGLWFYFS